MVPVLDVAVGVVAGAVVGAAELFAAVEVELEQGPQGPVGPACQKFSERGSCTIRSRDSDLAPDLDRLLVGPEPQLLVAREDGTQIRSGSKPKPSVESSQPQGIDCSLK